MANQKSGKTQPITKAQIARVSLIACVAVAAAVGLLVDNIGTHIDVSNNTELFLFEFDSTGNTCKVTATGPTIGTVVVSTNWSSIAIPILGAVSNFMYVGVCLAIALKKVNSKIIVGTILIAEIICSVSITMGFGGLNTKTCVAAVQPLNPQNIYVDNIIFIIPLCLAIIASAGMLLEIYKILEGMLENPAFSKLPVDIEQAVFNPSPKVVTAAETVETPYTGPTAVTETA